MDIKTAFEKEFIANKQSKTNFMKRLLFGAMLALGTLCVQSQELPNVVPPTPEAAALAKFTEIPVSHYTGLPNISVPIYTIQEGGVSIPISLGYHARGVQVSQIAPRTGMGWSLSYGGSISRQIRGKADDTATMNGYLSNGGDFTTYSTNLATRAAVDIKEQSNDGYDFYPDQFNFTAGGTSGKFVLDYTNGEPVIQSFADVIISYTRENGTSGRIDAFIVTDANGIKYYYGKSKNGQRTARDYQHSQGMSIYNTGNVVLDPGGASEDMFSSWKLMDIELVNGDLISYTYTYENGGNGAVYYRKSYDKHSPPPGSNVTNSAANMSDMNSIHTRISKIWNYENQLSKIEFNGGRDRIDFIKSTNKRDDYEGYSLDKISIYADNSLVKSFNLNYTYTTSTDTSSMLAYFVGNSLYTKYFKRMFLASVEEEGSDGTTLKPHEFTYDSQVLPAMFSSKQDYWGYYNGVTGNGPFTRPFDYGLYTVDRRVDTLKSEAGILKEIKYPTGGTTKLTYEHNKGTVPFEFNKLKIPSVNPGSQDEVEITLTKADFPIDPNTGGYTPYAIQLPYETQITYRVSCMHFQDPNNPLPLDCIFDFTVDGGQINIGEDVILTTGNSSSYSGTSTIGVFPVNHPGIPANTHLNSLYDFQIKIKYDSPDVRTNLYGPGKRIKKVEFFNGTDLVSTKEYEYVFPGTSTTDPSPSGGIIGLPAYLNTNIGIGGITFITHYNDTNGSFGSFQANGIGYSSVIEYYGTKQDNIGKTEYTFTNMMDTGGDYWEFPYHPPTDNEWLRGKPVKTKIFSAEKDLTGNITGYALKKEVYNKYRYANETYTADFEYYGFLHADFDFTPAGINPSWNSNITWDYINNRTLFQLPLFMRQRIATETGIDPNNTNNWGYRIYHLTGGTLHLDNTTEKEYNATGTLERTTTYNYDYPNHYQQKGSKMTDSNGDLVETINYYPADVGSFNSLGYDNLSTDEYNAIHKMKAPSPGNLTGTNQVATVVQVETKKNAVLLSTIRNNFQLFSGLALPKRIETSKAGASLEDRIVYHDYYSNGNIKEVSKTDGTHIVYIWGYDETVPVAKVENATAAQVNGYIGAIQTASNNDNDRTEGSAGNEGALRTALNNLRTALPNARVTSFTYDPLIGVTSITDPRGRTAYYLYDSFNRLQYVKDHDGNVLSKNEYHYKN